MALIDEQTVVNEAYVFLDEKRLLLAAELLRQLRLYQQLNAELVILHNQAKEAMLLAVKHHGLDGLQVYPSASFEAAKYRQTSRNFMGVILLETMLSLESDGEMTGETNGAGTNGAGTNGAGAGQNHDEKNHTISNPSIKADNCAGLFKDIVIKSAVLAGLSGNLYRLLAEYRITERRSRALENVILPEIEQSLRVMTSHLEELDLEEAVQVHLQSRKQL
jgi:V/A-type H+-transporting ATPase subunit D